MEIGSQTSAMRWCNRLLPYAGAGSVLVVWELTHRFGWLPPSLVPTPTATALRLVDLLTGTNGVIIDLKQSCLRMAFGFIPAAVVGAVVGLVLGSFLPLERFFSLVLEFVRSTPITATYPLWIVFCGLGDLSKSAMVFAATVPTVILSSVYGVQTSSPVRAEMARLFKASRWQVFWRVRFFDALPHMIVGFRVALSYALIVSIVVELFMGTQRGLGQRVFEAYQASQMADLFALVLLIGLVGWSLNRVFVFVEGRYFHWSGK